jgi:hypothetical protein
MKISLTQHMLTLTIASALSFWAGSIGVFKEKPKEVEISTNEMEEFREVMQEAQSFSGHLDFRPVNSLPETEKGIADEGDLDE